MTESIRPVGSAGDLVRRLRDGDEDAFTAIVREHRRPVYLVARRLLATHEEADEAAQETFVRAWRARDRFRGESAIGTWLVRIAINVARTLAGRRSPTAGLDEAPEPIDRTAGGDERLQREEARRRVRRAVASLPPRQREVVVLKVFSEMTHREVAAALGVTEGTAKAHLHQAVSNLRRALAREAREERSP